MSLDLSSLDADFNDAVAVEATGKPLLVDIETIDEDPNQPRKEFDDIALQELADDIKLRGVIQPISVRPSDDSNRWMVNFGARRLRASKLAGLSEIPVFVDDAIDDFAQVAENEKRDNLKPMELALFIQKKIDEGMKKKDIAKQIKMPATAISDYLALLTAPDDVLGLYRENRCTSPRILSDLCKLHQQFTKETTAWINAQKDDVTAKMVRQFSDELHNPVSGEVFNPTKETNNATAGNSSESPQESNANSGGEVDGNVSENSTDDAVQKLPFHNPNLEKNTPALPDPDVLKKPLLLGIYDNREIMVLINRRPSSDGLIFIRYEDDGADEEVAITDVQLNLLTSASK